MEKVDENKEEAITEESKKGSYLLGTIGALIGGTVASLPWILIYTFGNLIVAVLATLIAGGAFWGYKIFKGKIGKALPAIIAMVSILVVIISTTIICPLIMLQKEGLEISFTSLKLLYEVDEFKSAVMYDSFLSLVFAILGIAGIVKSISLQIKNGVDKGNLKFNTQVLLEEERKRIKKQCKEIKKVCISLGSMSKETAVTKREIINELDMTNNIEKKKCKYYVATAIGVKVLKKYKGKYYYDETDETSKLENIGNIGQNKKTFKSLIWVIIIVAVVSGITASLMTTPPETEKYEIPNTNIELNISESQVLYRTKEEISNAFGEYYAQYYDFTLVDNSNNKFELLGTVVDKSEIDENYNTDSIINSDRQYIITQWGEENVGEIFEKQFGKLSFKGYSYKYTNNEEQYNGYMYIGDAENNYLFIEIYSDIDFVTTQANSVMKELFFGTPSQNSK